MAESQQTMMIHSEVKVRLLKLYLERYLNVLSHSKYIGNIHIYDLFCGEGVYDNGGKGSPIIILETIKEIYYANKASGKSQDKFICKFNDIEQWKIGKLKREISNRNLHYPEIGELSFCVTDYRKMLPDVVREVESLNHEKAFIFIDPYGYKDIKLSDIKSLLNNRNTEVLLFLPTQFMFRFETKGTPECLIEFINELMPNDQWPESETGVEFIESLKRAFREYFGKTFFVDSFIITREQCCPK